MPVISTRKARSTLDKLVQHDLSEALSAAEVKATDFNPKAVALISSLLVDRLMANTQFINCVNTLSSKKNKEFLTTEQAARLSGFSRPVIIALLESNLYPGKVTKTPKGHRRIERSEFVAWLQTTSIPKNLPKTVGDVRDGPRDADPNETQRSKSETLAQRTERAKRLDEAHTLGVF